MSVHSEAISPEASPSTSFFNWFTPGVWIIVIVAAIVLFMMFKDRLSFFKKDDPQPQGNPTMMFPDDIDEELLLEQIRREYLAENSKGLKRRTKQQEANEDDSPVVAEIPTIVHFVAKTKQPDSSEKAKITEISEDTPPEEEDEEHD